MNPTCALLGLLARGERHGYDLKRTVDQEFAPFWRIDYAQLYRSLAKMKRRGWIKARLQAGAGGPDRKVYALTAAGRAALEGLIPQAVERLNWSLRSFSRAELAELTRLLAKVIDSGRAENEA